MENGQKQQVLSLLDTLGIPYAVHEHPAVYTCEEAALYDNGDGAADCKNLFLTNAGKKGYFLVVLPAEQKLRMKDMGRILGEKGLTFASEEDLLAHLGLTPGAVSPFGLINDRERRVTVVLDESLLASQTIKFHPNVNTASVTLATADFLAILNHLGHKRLLLPL